jgi:hypothetical protein
MEEYIPKALVLCEEGRVGSKPAIESLPLRVSQGCELVWMEMPCPPDAYAPFVWHQGFLNTILRYAEIKHCIEIHSIFELKYKSLRVLNNLQTRYIKEVGHTRENFFIYGIIRERSEYDAHYRIVYQYQVPLELQFFNCEEE